MIENGVLTYGAREEGILTWRFTNDILNEVVIAALLTIISYQAIEAMINLSFGLKTRGRAKLRDIQIMLLIRKSSPMAILRAIFPWQQRKRKDVPEYIDNMSETDTDMGHSHRVSAYLKLFCLLFAIPLVNVGSVVLSLERDKLFTFAEGQFGGLAFGLDFNRSITNLVPVSRMPQGICDSTTLQTNTAEFPIALFRSCIQDVTKDHDLNSNQTLFAVAVQGSPVNLVFVSIAIGTQKILYEKRIMINSNTADTFAARQGGQLYYMKANLTSSEAETLVDHGVTLAREFCDFDGDLVVDKKIEQGKEEGQLTVSASGLCPRRTERSKKEDLESAKTVALDLLSRLSFVDSDKLLVCVDDPDCNEFFNGDDLLLLSRRRALVSIPLMAILALAAVLLRILAQLLTNNDLERGIGLIVRDGLGLPCCDSMLCSPDVVAQYDSNGLILYDVDRSIAAGREELETLNG